MIYTFWILLAIIFYTYIGYLAVLMFLSLFIKPRATKTPDDELPHVTLLIAAYNERDIVDVKVENSFKLNYPDKKLHFTWITDGSDDGTPDKLKKYPEITVLHLPERAGKTAAINRAMEFIETPIVVFCDANTMLNKDAIYNIAQRFGNQKTGCVAGEKRIEAKQHDTAPGAGEGSYWKYESLLKTLESRVGYCMGAVGELFALRTGLFEKVPNKSIIDDFVISLSIALKGYKIEYAPEAFSTETASVSIKDEMKRKIRIASGGFQTLFGMPQLLNFFRHGMLTWQFISHKVSRWLLAPLALILLFATNIFIITQNPVISFYSFSLLAEIAIILLAIIGATVKKKQIRFKSLFIPYYFFVMNYTQILGLLKYIKGDHSVIWEKVNRQDSKQ